MSLPIVPFIQSKHPDAQITWLCGRQVAPILEKTEGIKERIVVDEKSLFSGGLTGKTKEILRIWGKLSGRKFDLVLYYYHSPLYKILLLPVRYTELRSFGKQASGSSLPVPGRHHSIEYIQTFARQAEAFQFRLEYPPFQNPKKEKSNDQIRICLSPGGAKNVLRDDGLRRWPAANYRKLAELILQQGWKLSLVGAPSDTWVREHFQGIDFEDHIGRYDLPGFVTFLSGEHLLVTHDSGPLHLADLANCPVLGLFGPTMPEEKKSLLPESRYLWGGADLHCRPCYDGKEYGVCSANLCLSQLSPERVFQEIQEMVAIQMPASSKA